MAIKASDLMKSAEGDPAALQQSHAPDVMIGGDLVVGGDLAVPAGQTWRVNGNVKIEDGAALRIEDGATLALTGIATDLAAGSGQQRRRITVGDAVRYLAGGDSGQQLRAQIEQYELETEPTDAKRQNLERLRRAAFDAEPTDADRQRLERLKAEADRFMLVSPEEAERLRAQIDHPFLLSPDEAKRAAAQFTSLMAPTAFEGYAAELMRPPHPKEAIASADLAAWTSPVALAMAENLRQMVEPVMLSAGSNLAEMLRRASEPAMISLAQQIQDAAAEQGRQMMAAINGMAWPGPNIAEQIAEQNKQAMAAFNSLTLPRQTIIDAMSDLDSVRRAVRNSGISLGALDDLNISLGRLHEQRQAPPVRRPEPEQQSPYVQLDYALQKGVWQPVEVLEKLLQYGDVCAYIAEMLERKPGPRQDDGNYSEEKVKEMWLAWLIADTKKRKELLDEWNIAPEGKYHYKLFRQYKLPLGGKKDTN